MKHNKIRLTESQLRSIIRTTARKILKENSDINVVEVWHDKFIEFANQIGSEEFAEIIWEYILKTEGEEGACDIVSDLVIGNSDEY